MANSGAALAGRCIMGDGTQTAWPRIPTAALTASESSGGKSQTPGILPLLCPGITHSRVALIVICSYFAVCLFFPPVFLLIFFYCGFWSFNFRVHQLMDLELNCHWEWCHPAVLRQCSAFVYSAGICVDPVSYSSCSICFHFLSKTNKQNVCVTDGQSTQGPEGHFVLNIEDLWAREVKRMRATLWVSILWWFQ